MIFDPFDAVGRIRRLRRRRPVATTMPLPLSRRCTCGIRMHPFGRYYERLPHEIGCPAIRT